VLAACPQAPDRAVEHSLIYALIEGGRTEPLLEALDSPDRRVRRAALIALDQGRAGHAAPVRLRDHVLAACRDDDPALRAAGWWIASGHPEWVDPLAGQVATELARASSKPEERERIVAVIAKLAANASVADALAAACQAEPPAVRAKACETMRSARPVRTPDSWVDGLVALMAGDSPAAVADAVETLASLTLTSDQRSRVRPTVLSLAADPSVPPKLCMLLIQVAGATDPVPHAVVERLVFMLGSDSTDAGVSPLDRSAAATALRRAQLTDDQLVRLTPALARLPAHDVAELLPIFTARAGEPLVAGLAAVSRHPDQSAISRDTVAAAVAALPFDQATMGTALLGRIDAARAGQREAYERLATSLPPGDSARGHAVFVSSKAACTGCHAMAYVGGRIGPDLSTIGKIRTARDLLEAIVLPSASFVRSYEPVTVLTIDGRVFAGIVREETTNDFVLQTNANTSERIPRSSIDAIEAGTVSLMPKGYDTILSPQELADLVAFLAQAK
jgi:putative heme-binding domain-containing protein